MSEQTIDPAVFGEMQDLMDDALGEFISTYLDNSPRLISKIAQGLSADDTELIYHSAHQLKGGSGSIGAMGLFELAQQIEKISRAGSVENLDALLQQLQTEFEQVKTALQPYT